MIEFLKHFLGICEDHTSHINLLSILLGSSGVVMIYYNKIKEKFLKIFSKDNNIKNNCWIGRVIKINNDSFDAIGSFKNTKKEELCFLINEIPKDERHLLKNGALFEWTFEKPDNLPQTSETYWQIKFK